MQIRNINDVLAGLFLIAVGALALALTWNLRIGSTASMGPGYLPKLLIAIQTVLGAAIVARGILGAPDRLQLFVPRPLVFILASVAFFGVAIERFGLAASVFGLVILAALAHRGTRPVEGLLLAAGLAAFAVLVFVKALGLPLAIWPAALVR